MATISKPAGGTANATSIQNVSVTSDTPANYDVLMSDGTDWNLRTLIADDNLEFYVDPAGSDTTGDGSVGNPYQTIMYALKQARRISGVGTITIWLQNGTYTGSITVPACFGNSIVYIKSVSGNPNNVTINAGGGTNWGIIIKLGIIWVQDITITNAYYGIVADAGGTAYVRNVVMTSITYCGIVTQFNSNIIIRGNITITCGGAGDYGIYASFGGNIVRQATGTVTINNVQWGVELFNNCTMAFSSGTGSVVVVNSAIPASSYGLYVRGCSSVHDCVLQVTKCDIGMGVYQQSYVDLDTPTFTSCNTNTVIASDASADLS